MHWLYARIIWTINCFVFSFILVFASEVDAQIYLNKTTTYKDTITTGPTHSTEREIADIFEINGLIKYRGEELNEIDVRANFVFINEDGELAYYNEYLETLYRCIDEDFKKELGKGPYYIGINLDSAGRISRIKSLRSVNAEENLISYMNTCGLTKIEYSFRYMNFDEIFLVFRRNQRVIGEREIEYITTSFATSTKKKRKKCSFFNRNK